MKIAVSNNSKTSTVATLQELVPANNAIVFVESINKVCYFYDHVATGDYEPNTGGGWWVIDILPYTSLWEMVANDYDFVANNKADISTIENWDISLFMDWSRRRDEISPLFYAVAGSQLQNFAGLSPYLKILACRYFFIPYSFRLEIVGEDQDYINGQYLLSQTKKSRVNCVEAMRQYVWNEYVRKNLMTLTQSQQMLDDIDQDYKIQKFIDSNNQLFKNWVFGLAPYVDIFNTKDYYSVDLQNGLIDIYNGNY